MGPIRTAATTATVTAGVAAALVVGLAAPTAAAPPEVVEIDRAFTSHHLSTACGFPVQQHLVGTFSTTTHRSRTITQYRFRSTLTAGGAVVDSRAYGPTIEEHHEDGSVTATQLGVTMRNVPGTGTVGPSAGRTIIVYDLEGGELVVSESGYGHDGKDRRDDERAAQDLAELCAALAP